MVCNQKNRRRQYSLSTCALKASLLLGSLAILLLCISTSAQAADWKQTEDVFGISVYGQSAGLPRLTNEPVFSTTNVSPDEERLWTLPRVSTRTSRTPWVGMAFSLMREQEEKHRQLVPSKLELGSHFEIAERFRSEVISRIAALQDGVITDFNALLMTVFQRTYKLAPDVQLTWLSGRNLLVANFGNVSTVELTPLGFSSGTLTFRTVF
jgi:hypothetical protein